MNDEEMARRLELIGVIYTPFRRTPNDVIEVGPNSVTLVSHQGGHPRPRRIIPYDHIRNYRTVMTHGVIVRALAQSLGLYEGDRRANAADEEQE